MWTSTVSLLWGGYASNGLTGLGSLLIAQIKTDRTIRHPRICNPLFKTPSVPKRLIVFRWKVSCWTLPGSTVLTAKIPPMLTALRKPLFGST
jgi:hypothetical protein